MPNSKIAAGISLIICAISMVGMAIPYYTGLDGNDGGFALITVCLAVFTVAMICAVVFRWMSYKEKKILNGENLAHWTYTDDEWRKFADAEQVVDAAGMRATFVFGIVFSAICAIGFYIYNPEIGIYVACIMVGLA